MARRCFICGFQLQLGISSQRGPYLFRFSNSLTRIIPTSIHQSLLFICSIHFDKECLKALNNVWYLRRDSIPTRHLESHINLAKVRVLSLNLQQISSKIKNKMDNNEDKVDIISGCSSFCLSSLVFDVDPYMPTLSLDLNECGNPQNLTSWKLKPNAATKIWSYNSATFSEEDSSNSSPPSLHCFDQDDKEPFSSCVSAHNHINLDLVLPGPEVTFLEKTDGWKERTPVPRINLTAIPPSRRSIRTKSQLRKSFSRKDRPEGCCPSASEFPYLAKRQIKKTKSKKAPCCIAKYVSDISNTDLTTLRYVDEIDGFTISSFATFKDLDEFGANQFSMLETTKNVSNSPVEESIYSRVPDNDLPNVDYNHLRHIDDIDGFRISSFSTLEDLDKFSVQQSLIQTHMKTIPDEAETTTGRCPAVPERLHCSVPDDCRLITLPNPSNSSSSNQPRSSINRQKPVYSFKRFAANRRYAEKRYIFIRLKQKIKDLKKQLSTAHKALSARRRGRVGSILSK